MKSTEIIKDLSINYIGHGAMPRKCYLLNHRIDKNITDLKEILYKKNKKKLDKLCDDFTRLNSIECEESVVDGFSFAVQLLSEADNREM